MERDKPQISANDSSKVDWYDWIKEKEGRLLKESQGNRGGY